MWSIHRVYTRHKKAINRTMQNIEKKKKKCLGRERKNRVLPNPPRAEGSRFTPLNLPVELHAIKAAGDPSATPASYIQREVGNYL